MIKTPYSQGWDAGYRDENNQNPFATSTEQFKQYEIGYRDGRDVAGDDLYEKRVAFARGF